MTCEESKNVARLYGRFRNNVDVEYLLNFDTKYLLILKRHFHDWYLFHFLCTSCMKMPRIIIKNSLIQKIFQKFRLEEIQSENIYARTIWIIWAFKIIIHSICHLHKSDKQSCHRCVFRSFSWADIFQKHSLVLTFTMNS